MNRPEPIELENNLGPDAVTGEINRVPWMAYDVDEMNLYIAEKDKEIESLKASHYAEMVDAGMRERRLRRALWMHRAITAKFNNEACKAMREYNPFIGIEEYKWQEVERKCRAKAEECK